MIVKKTKTPCIGVCSTGIGDSVCRGCKRFTHEVIHWNGYSEAERLAVMARLNSLLAQVVRSKVLVIDSQLLMEQMRLQKISFNSSDDPYCLVFFLLKAGAKQIEDLESFGCKALSEWVEKPLTELRDVIDADYYTLSSVHYERYFATA